ncbi:MAG: TonB-dependent receptor [Candidatus Neomarinimicrobiota bacterium]|nr:MAG: TonB-dependent receptor [Candidatus Neomarinimicrobiota bacterium]
MKRLAVLVAVVVLPVFVFAQTSGKIAGVVKNTDGQVLVGANVLVEGTTFGAATDAEGRYYILDVPVGTYTVRAEYIGYKAMSVSNIRVSADLTTQVDFTLEVSAVAGQEVQVTAERPIINKNATNTNRIIETEVVQALPVRDVTDVVDLQTGVVNGHVRGGRTGDNAYYVDGVLVRNNWNGNNLTGALSQRGTQEVAVQTGGFTAEYGNANGGIVNVVSKTGASKFSGSAEFVTDLGSKTAGTDKNALYNYGYSVFNFDVGGPLTKALRFYLNVEKEQADDASPSSITAPYAEVQEFTSGLSSADSAAIWVNGDPNQGLNPSNIYFEQFIKNNQSNPTELAAAFSQWGGFPLDSIRAYHPDWLDTTYVLAKNYEQRYGPKRGASSEQLKASGNVVLDLKPLRLKVGGSMFNYSEQTYQHGYELLNWKNMPKFDSYLRLGYLNGTMTLSPKSYIRGIVSLKNYNNEEYNPNWKDDIMAYGRRTTEIGSPNYYYRDHGKNTLSVPALINFSGYGAQWGRYIKRSESTMGLRADFVNQVNVHEFKAGMEYYNTTIRYYRVSQAREIFENVAKLDANFDGQLSQDELGDYNADGVVNSDDMLDWKYTTYRNAYTYNIGYNIFGDQTDSYKMDDHSQEPGNAINMRYYVSDKIELSDVVMNLGLSFESFNPNAYAPDSDGDGVGDDAGFDNLYTKDGRIDRDRAGADGANKWEKVPTETALQPRIGFAFPVTDRTVFHAQYGQYWQAPPLVYLYLSDSRLAANLTQGNMTVSPNPTLKPEKSTSYEIGFTQQIGQMAALDVTGFYKEVRDYILMKNRENAMLDGSEFSWAQYVNGDFGVTQGFSFNVRMRRVKGFIADLNYTMMWARGTGSDPGSNFNIAWTGDTYPTVINRLDFDQRHTGSIMVDYRSPARSGLLADFGANAVFTFGSGTAYTPSVKESAVFGRGWYAPVAAINSGSLPWSQNLDIRVDKGIRLGGIKLNAYVLVRNVLNAQNVNTVYPSSGEAGEDGWLATPEGQTWLNGQLTNYPTVDAVSLYHDRTQVPSRYGIPRMVRFGVTVNL